MSDVLSYLENEDGKFAIPCQIKIAEDCVQQGEFAKTRKTPGSGLKMSAGLVPAKVISAPNVMTRSCVISQTLPPKRCSSQRNAELNEPININS